MTRERKYHVTAISLLVAGLVAGGVSWALVGAAFWAVVGASLVLVITGAYVASIASAEQRNRQQQGK